jgi:hypothetical protein
MRKLLMFVMILTIVLSVPALAQWNFVKVFPDTNFSGSTGIHGLAVDPDGKLWVQYYGANTKVVDGAGDTVNTRELWVFNPDGTQAPFSGMNIVDYGDGTADTLYNSGRGLRADQNGNILGSFFDEVFRIDYTNGQGLGKAQPSPGNTLDAVCVTDIGEVICGFVIPPLPIQIWDENFTFLGNAVDSAFGFSRAFEISKDGNDIYWGSFTTGYTVKIHSDFGTLGPYSTFDTILVGMKPESFGWNPKDGYLYISSGNFSDVPSPEWTNHTWYAYDPATNTVKDSLTWNFAAYPYPTDATFGPRARAIAFSPGGDTAYVGMYNYATAVIQMFVRGVTSVEPVGTTVPEEYTLSQNYPNPFNPTTEIQFSIPATGQTSLIVYDMLGREVATLVNDNLTAGSYKAKFDAASLSSGTYVYILTSNGYRMTKKMMLIK